MCLKVYFNAMQWFIASHGDGAYKNCRVQKKMNREGKKGV